MRTDIDVNTAFVINWTTRMTRMFGATVYDTTDPTQRYDWGQALCREQYGMDWSDVVPDSPTSDDAERAREWEAGDWPNWAWTLERKENLHRADREESEDDV